MKRTLITAGAVFTADIAVKLLCRRFLTGTIRLGSLVELRLVENSGIAFGLFSGTGIVTLILPPVVLLLGWLLLRKTSLSKLGQLGAGLIAGGFLGNYAERLGWGRVTDMIYFPWLPFFVCNLADIAICAGAVLLFIALLIPPKKENPDV